MGFGDIQGRARTDPSAPRAQGVCDECGEHYNLLSLRKQMQWFGTALRWTGDLVCQRCICAPQAQLKAIRLPADPVPVGNPRPEFYTPVDMPLGFTTYTLWASGQPIPYGVELMDGSGNPILDNFGQPILIEIGTDGIALLAQLSAITGVPVPGDIQIYGGTLAAPLVAQQLIPAAVGSRTYIAIFNPCTAPIWVSTGTASSVSPSLTLGPGQALFWATAQGFGAPYQGAMTVYGNIASVPFYAYANP